VPEDENREREQGADSRRDPARSDEATRLGTAELLRVPALDRERPLRGKLITVEVGVRALFLSVAALSVAVVLVNAVLTWSFLRVPELVGQPQAQALEELDELNLRGLVVREQFSAKPLGQIIEQSPVAGERLRRGRQVDLVVSNGIEGLLIPDLTGDDLSAARTQLERLGLIVTVVEESSDSEPGTVIGTDPGAGTQARYGDPVLLRIATRTSDTALVDFRLSGIKVVIEPRYTQTGGGDVSFETARRLSSLFQAAGATVKVTRSSNERQVSASAYASRAEAANPRLYIVLAVAGGDHEGLVIKTPSADDAALGEEVFKRLSVHFPDSATLREVSPFGPANAQLRLEVVLGTTSSQNDSLLFKDAQWSDRVARAIYMAAGTTLRGTNTP